MSEGTVNDKDEFIPRDISSNNNSYILYITLGIAIGIILVWIIISTFFGPDAIKVLIDMNDTAYQTPPIS